jgi:hypothetical protein
MQPNHDRLTASDVFAILTGERLHQTRKWGDLDAHPLTVGDYLLVMQQELGEAVQAWTKGHPDDTAALCEVVQVAAVAVACLEQHGFGLAVEMATHLERVKDMGPAVQPDARLAAWSEALWGVCRANEAVAAEVGRRVAARRKESEETVKKWEEMSRDLGESSGG